MRIRYDGSRLSPFSAVIWLAFAMVFLSRWNEMPIENSIMLVLWMIGLILLDIRRIMRLWERERHASQKAD